MSWPQSSSFERSQPADHIGIIGSSLGGAAALLAHPPLRVDALILEAVYPTIEVATKNRLQNYLGPIGRWFAPLLLKQLHTRLGVSADELRPINHIGNVSCPILLINGEKDRNTRPEDAPALFFPPLPSQPFFGLAPAPVIFLSPGAGRKRNPGSWLPGGKYGPLTPPSSSGTGARRRRKAARP